MASVARLYLLRVFCGDDGAGGNPLAVFLEGDEVPPQERQGVAADLARSETVFVDHQRRGEIRIYTPAVELDFAGHPSVGTAWLLAREREPVDALRPPAGELAVRYEAGHTFVAALPAWGPPFELAELSSPAAVDALEGPRADTI